MYDLTKNRTKSLGSYLHIIITSRCNNNSTRNSSRSSSYVLLHYSEDVSMAHDSLRRKFKAYQFSHCVQRSILSRIRRSLSNVMRILCMQDFQTILSSEPIPDPLKKIRLSHFISVFDTTVVSLAAVLRPELFGGI